jgi:DNA modification methylase
MSAGTDMSAKDADTTLDNAAHGGCPATTCYASPCGRVTLYLGDCLPLLATVKADAIISDPPYGIAHKSGGGTGGKWHKVKHQGVTIEGDSEPFDPSPLLRTGLPFVLWGANFFSEKLPGSGWLVWDKRPGIEDMKFNRSDAELAALSGSKTVKTFRHLWHGICRDTEVGEHLHPTQKPVALMAWCMEQAKVPAGAVVVDPYMGSGTTGIACIRTGRRFVGIEKDPAHYATALKRITDELAQGDLFLGHNA